MSSCDRRAFLISLAALSGCGYTPVLAPGNDRLRGLIDVAEPADEEGFALVRRLEERLGTPSAARYSLIAGLSLDQKSVGILPDGAITRFTIDGQVDWRIVRIGDGSVVMEGTERSFASYSATSTQVATIRAERDTRRRLMVILADLVVADILSRADAL